MVDLVEDSIGSIVIVFYSGCKDFLEDLCGL